MYKASRVLKLLLAALLSVLIVNSSYATNRPVFEKGDAIYRKGDLPGSWLLGHAGLYWEWVDLNEEGIPNDPNDLKTHKVIESLAEGVTLKNNFDDFYHPTERFWGVYTCHALTATQRQFIIDMAKIQRGCEYAFFRGYKNPSDYDEYGNYALGSFRCDGLVEYCYEVAFGEPWEPGNNRGLILNDTWRSLRPEKQMNSSKFEIRTEAEVKEVRLVSSEEGTLKAYASDGDYGSGITMVEFWNGKPDATPDSTEGTGKRLDQGWDAHDADVGDYYTHYYGGTVTHLYAKAFDQAGNTIVRPALEDTYVSATYPDINCSTYGWVELRRYLWGPVRAYYSFPKGYRTLHIYLHAPVAKWYKDEDLPDRHLNVYSVDGTTFQVSTVTWNSQPARGALIDTVTVNLRDICDPGETFYFTGERYGKWYTINIAGQDAICIEVQEPYGGRAEFEPSSYGHSGEEGYKAWYTTTRDYFPYIAK